MIAKTTWSRHYSRPASLSLVNLSGADGNAMNMNMRETSSEVATSAQRNSSLNRRSILLVCNDIGRGGAEIQLVDVAFRLAERGHSVTVCALMTFTHFESDLNAAGVNTFELGMKKGLLRPQDLFRFAQQVRHLQPDIVHAHLFGSAVVARLARCFAPSTAVVCTLHVSFEHSPWRYRIARATDFLADATTNVCSPGLRAYVDHRAIPQHKAHYTPNGVDIHRFRHANSTSRAALRTKYGADGRFIWLTAGSFHTEQKGYSDLLEAFKQLTDQVSSSEELSSSTELTELWIAGDGVLREVKEKEAAALGIANHVRFLGLRSDVGELMKAADGFVLGSRYEAHPIVLLEAAAMELPAVATDVGGNVDIIEQRKTGYLVPSNDSCALAHAMAKLIQLSPEERAAMGRRASNLVDARFNLDVVVDRWEALYGDILDCSNKRTYR